MRRSCLGMVEHGGTWWNMVEHGGTWPILQLLRFFLMQQDVKRPILFCFILLAMESFLESPRRIGPFKAHEEKDSNHWENVCFPRCRSMLRLCKRICGNFWDDLHWFAGFRVHWMRHMAKQDSRKLDAAVVNVAQEWKSRLHSEYD